MTAENFSCDICSGPVHRFLPFRGINQDNPLEVEAFNGRWIWRCAACGHCAAIPKPPPQLLTRYYAGSYWSGGSTIAARLRPMLRAVRARLQGSRLLARGLAEVQMVWPHIEARGGVRWLEQGTVLEIGAGPAEFTRALQTRAGGRLRCHVVEPDNGFRTIYRLCGIEKTADTFEEFSASTEYSLIGASEWLEHAGDVKLVFERLSQVVAPHGLIFLGVPNTADPYWKYRHYPDPPHLQYFTPGSLTELARRHGFEVLQLQTRGRPLAYEEHIGYLDPHHPPLLARAEIDLLAARRVAREQALRREMQARGQVYEDGGVYPDATGEYVQVVLTRAVSG